MDNLQIKQIHGQVLELYTTSLLPIVRKYFGKETNLAKEKQSDKYANTLVTQADLAVHTALFENLPKILPGASVISEECNDRTITKYTFIIDPIDGTHTFARNLDDWGISIVLIESGEVIYAVIFFPNCNTKYYYAIKGLGAFDSEDKKVSPRAFFKFKPTIVCAPFSRKTGRALIELTKNKMLSFKAYGSVVYALYTQLRGGTDFLVFDHLNIWDVLGCAFIAEQTGLVVKWVGTKPNYENKANHDILTQKYTLITYKPDFDKNQLDDLVNMVNLTSE